LIGIRETPTCPSARGIRNVCLEEPEGRCSHMAVSEAPCRQSYERNQLASQTMHRLRNDSNVRAMAADRRHAGIAARWCTRPRAAGRIRNSSSHSATRRDAQKLAISLVISWVGGRRKGGGGRASCVCRRATRRNRRVNFQLRGRVGKKGPAGRCVPDKLGCDTSLMRL
jgi:hypothetical protein